MDAAVAAEKLGEVAIAARVGERAASRLVELRAVFGADLAYVERELARSSAEGRLAGDRVGDAPARGRRQARAPALRAPRCGVLWKRAVVRRGARARDCRGARPPRDAPPRRRRRRLGHCDAARPASRRVWGNAVSVLAGDLLSTHALERTAAVARHYDEKNATMTELLRTLRRLVDGEVVQLRGRTTLEASESVYLQSSKERPRRSFRGRRARVRERAVRARRRWKRSATSVTRRRRRVSAGRRCARLPGRSVGDGQEAPRRFARREADSPAHRRAREESDARARARRAPVKATTARPRSSSRRLPPLAGAKSRARAPKPKPHRARRARAASPVARARSPRRARDSLTLRLSRAT